MRTSFFSDIEVKKIGFKSYGENVLISRKACFYVPEDISLGNNVRIDDFCILTGKINLGSFIHISAYSALYGANGINIEDFSGLSPRVTLFSASDDFSGDFLINPMIPNRFTNVKGGTINIGKYCQIGAHSIVMPGVNIPEGTVVGAMSFVKNNLDSWMIYAGNPLKEIKPRSKKLLNFIDKIL
jgi:acetyltransferase-like isoleucine patch superfamily enzyme